MSSLVKHRDDQSTNEANTLQFKNIIEARYRKGFLQNLKIQSNVFVVLSNFKEVARKAKKKKAKAYNFISLKSSSELLTHY